jgi:hypothetical protein
MAEFLSRRDVDFLLYEWLDVVELTKRDHFAEHSRDTFEAVLDLSADIATNALRRITRRATRASRRWDRTGRSC